jgi:predicted enzyme related to lactoylglutathione lyase
MDANANNLNWFEIPVTDLSRAKSFYESIFEITMNEMEMGDMKMASFPYDPGSGKASGGIAQSSMHKPSADGSIIYLNANPSMDAIVGRIEGAGGKVVMPKTQITPEIGYMAFFMDTEGNKVGLHSQN